MESDRYKLKFSLINSIIILFTKKRLLEVIQKCRIPLITFVEIMLYDPGVNVKIRIL